MPSNVKGSIGPQIPSTTWEFMALARDVIGLPAFHRIFGVEKSQVSRWAVNPDFSADSQRNPLDRLRMLFERMVEAGESAAVVSMISELARPLGGPVEVCAPVIPERETVQEELLDIHPACTEHSQSIREDRGIRAVEHWEAMSIKEIREATEKYRQEIG